MPKPRPHGWRTRRPDIPGWAAIRLRILRRDSYKCQRRDHYGRPCLLPASEVDHIVPVSQGGSSDPANLQALCRECHRAKTLAERYRTEPRRRKPESHPGGY